MAESMKDFETELEQSFQVIKEGDVLEVEVIGISETELTVDLNYYTEGIIPLEECSDDPAFSIKNDCNIGDRIQAMVIDAENENGVVILSKKAAHNLMIWDELEEDYQNRTVFQVKITDTTSGGIIGYVKGVRAFIPASKIELNYVEDTSGYLGMTLEAMIITVDKEAKRLVLSAKEIQKERKAKEYVQKVGQLTVGDVVTGTVDRIESYGVFITIGEDLTGLCHISQITNKFIKSPKEIVKLGDTVTAQIIKLEGDRVFMDLAIVTAGDAMGYGGQEFADYFYDDNGLGEGSDKSGVLLLLDMDNREIAVSTSGKMIRYLTDVRVETILDDVYERMVDEEYYEAASVFLSDVEVCYENGIAGDQFTYDQETGRVSVYRRITVFEFLTALLLAAVCGGAAVLSVSKSYKKGRKDDRMAANFRLSYRKDSAFRLGSGLG